MAIIVEDGTIVSGANSYVTRIEYIAYALTLGIIIADSVNSDVHLIKSTEYINQHEANIKGDRVERDQSLSFPRVGVYIDGFYWDSDEIPRNVILCQLAYALDVNSGEDLNNRSLNPEKMITKERVEGAVAVEYASSGSSQKLSKTSSGDALLNSFLKNNGMMSIELMRA